MKPVDLKQLQILYLHLSHGWQNKFITYLKGKEDSQSIQCNFYDPTHDVEDLFHKISNLDITLDLPIDHLMDV